jgi:diguanylate cyclase (GGDEF)-like protein
MVIASSACALAIGLYAAPAPTPKIVLAVAGLTICAIIGIVRPLHFAYKAEVYLDSAILMLALLILEPGYALLVAAAAGAIANAINRRTPAEILFNAAQMTLITATGALVLHWFDWQPSSHTVPWPESVIATIAAGTAMFLVNTAIVAVIIALQARTRIIGIWYDMTFREDRAEVIAYAAQLGIGLLGAVVATSEPWALALLAIPAVAVYISLEQHVDMRRRAELNLEAAQRLVGLGSWDWDLRSGDQRWSNELFNIVGLSPHTATASSESYLGVVHPDDRTAVSAAIGAAAVSGLPYSIDHRIVPGDGSEERVIHARGEVYPSKNGKPGRLVGTVHDITQRKRLEQRLQHQAFHDPLTDLPNRIMFQQQLDQAIQRAGKRIAIGVLFLDLDRFKLINDTFGHEAGDQLLITVAQRLRACTRPGDIVARIGGDEFTILLLHVSSELEVISVAERIIQQITVPIVLPGNREIVISTSIGIVRPEAEQRTGADFLRDADNALYRAKERGRNQYVLFDATMGAETKERVALEADLRRAIERDQLLVMYQPKIDLASGRPVAVEAFVRWNHPERGWVPPDAFIPIAEEIGLISHIGRWVLKEACREAAGWPSIGGEELMVSVNLSGKQFHDPEIATELETLLNDSGLPPRRLHLEITETVAMQNADATIQALWRLQKLGVRVVIDDFGTGYSSLSSLQRFPVDTLQLDRSFVANLGRIREAKTVTQAVIGLAHGLGLKVVAEGVERREQLDQLLELGCEQAQGNLFSAPLTSCDLSTYLAKLAWSGTSWLADASVDQW